VVRGEGREADGPTVLLVSSEDPEGAFWRLPSGARLLLVSPPLFEIFSIVPI